MNSNSTILIVDDEDFIRDIMEGLLSPQGYNLAFATNGIEAVAKAKELIPDLILLDVMMPDMDGFEACQHLRADPILAEVPIIIITALDDRESRLQGIQAGADDFISKPFNVVELQARVQTITRLNRYRRLLMERHKFEWVIEQDKDGYLILGDDTHILYANPQARLYLGLDDNTPILEPFLDLVSKQYQCQPEVAWDTWPALPTIDSPRYLVSPETQTNQSVWLQVELLEMFSQAGEGYLVRLHDISASVVARKLRWTFHEQVSHKFKTPLTKLTGFIGVLKEDFETLSGVEAHTILDIMDQSATQLQDEILSVFQYLESLEHSKNKYAWCCLAEVSPIIDELKANLDIDTINLSFDTHDNLDNIVGPVSRHILDLILQELLQNAKKFHPKQSPVIDIKISSNSTTIHIQISDDGLTLPPEQLVKMWIPYYQVENSFSGQVPGMGLGLSMVTSLLWNVNGSCRAYNREDKAGIVIELTLPLAKS